MATGVPRKLLQIANGGANQAFELTYTGKRPKAEILCREAPSVTCAWRGSTTPAGRLYFAENAGALSALAADPEICGKVRVVYIDPPFATQTAFHSRRLDHAYEDLISGTAYVEFLRERLILLHRLLDDDGSLYLHLDSKMLFHMKVILDEVFGASGFRTCIARKKCNPKNYTRKQYGNVVDYILFYTKSSKWVWNRPVEQWNEGRAKEYRYIDPTTGRRFMKVPVHAPGTRNGETGGHWRGKLPPPGKHWQYAPRTLDEMDARGEIYWSPNGNPRRKVFLDESSGVGVQDIWMEFRDAHNQNICITGYPTEKNPALLRRIIEASSDPGDLVLDCFAGSGTALAVADELGRRWIGVDNSAEALRTMLDRFTDGTAPMGDFVGVKGKQTAAGPLTPMVRAPRTTNGEKSHHAVRNFAIWVQDDLKERAVPIIQAWEKRQSPHAVPIHQKAMCELIASVPA